MTEIFTAKRVEDAKKMAVEHFGVSEDQIVFRILEEPKKGFLGFGKKGEAKIEAIYEPPVAAAAEAEKAEPAAPNKQPIESVAAPQKPAVPEPVVAPEKPAEVPQQETVSAASQAEEPERKLLTDEELEPNIKKAKEYVLSIYREMGVPITITTYQQENGIAWKEVQLAKKLDPSVLAQIIHEAGNRVAGVKSDDSVTVTDVDEESRTLHGEITITTDSDETTSFIF